MTGDRASRPSPPRGSLHGFSLGRRAWPLTVVLGLAFTGACGEVVVQPAEVASVVVDPGESQVAVGATVQLTASVLDAQGRAMSGIPIAWTSTDTATATVSGNGMVTGRRGGQAQIRAAADGRTGSASVQVLRPPQVVLDRTVIGFSASFGGSAPPPALVAVTNGGDLPLTGLTADIDFGDGPTGWLTVVLAATTAPTSLALAATQSGLQPGDYAALVRVDHPAAAGPESVIVTLEVREIPGAPAAPSGLSATATQNEAEISLAWTDNSAGETGFAIERRGPGESQFTLLATTAANVAAYLDASVTPDGTYVYRVAACAASTCSAFSNQSSATTYPNAPSGLQATPQSSSRIDLAWADNSATETQFRIERRTGGGSFAQVATEGANTTTHSDGGLAAGTSYTYRVRACNSGGCSAYTGEASATTLATPAPAPPSGLTATTVSAGRIDLAWTPGSGDATELRLERRVNGGPFSLRHTMGAGTTEFSDLQVSADNAYTYRIEACTGGGLCSDWSNEASAVTPPVPPSGLAAAAESTSAIRVTWTDDVRTEDAFQVQRMPAGGSFTDIATLPAGSTELLDQGLSPETAYTYRVRSCNAAGCSAYTAAVTATTRLPAPSSLSAVAVNATRIDLNWTDNSSAESEFRIERRTGGTGPFSQVATVPANATSYADEGRTPETLYQYHVLACTSEACSERSNRAEATTPATPAAPAALSATATSTTSITLAWTNHSATADEVRIERSTAGGAWSQVTVVGSDVESYADGGLSAETAYSYRVRACSGSACSSYSNQAAAVTWIPAPTGLAATVVSSTQVDLTWTDNAATETGYSLRRSDPGGTSFTEIQSLGPGSENATDATTAEATAYAYRVAACNDHGCAESATAPATTPPFAPTGFSAIATSATAVSLSWTDASAAGPGFRIQRQLVGDWADVASVPAGTTSFEDVGLTPDTIYHYRIQACAAACSDWVQVTVATAPGP
jgi:hypothetical protein